jgi:hypothetical protein
MTRLVAQALDLLRSPFVSSASPRPSRSLIAVAVALGAVGIALTAGGRRASAAASQLPHGRPADAVWTGLSAATIAAVLFVVAVAAVLDQLPPAVWVAAAILTPMAVMHWPAAITPGALLSIPLRLAAVGAWIGAIRHALTRRRPAHEPS